MLFRSYLVADGNKVFVTTQPGPLRAFRASDGKLLWKTRLPYEDFFDYVPAVAGGYLYPLASGESSIVYKVDENTGKVLWHVVGGGGVGASVGDGKVFFPFTCDVLALTPDAGKAIWNYYSGCEGGGGVVAAYYNGTLYAPKINFGDGGVILKSATGLLRAGLSGGTPAFAGSTSYSIIGKALVASFINGGNIRWYFAPGDPLNLPPITINGTVYTLSGSGKLYVNDGKTGRLLQIIKVGTGSIDMTNVGPPRIGLGVAPGLLLVPSGSILAAFAPG